MPPKHSRIHVGVGRKQERPKILKYLTSPGPRKLWKGEGIIIIIFIKYLYYVVPVKIIRGQGVTSQKQLK